MESQSESVKSFRELLRYVLQEFQTRGGRLTLPVGCYHLEDWLLDAVNVPKLLRLLQTEREVNLVQACEGAGGTSFFIPGSPGPLAQGAGAASARESPVFGHGTNGRGERPRAECDLQLPLPRTGMSEEELQFLAYTIYVGCCSSYCSEQLSDDVRRQLQISVSAAHSLQQILAEAASMQSQAASSLEMIVMLLRLGRPRHFESFQAFLSWRSSFATAVCQSLALGAAEAATSNDRQIRQGASARTELLRMKMYMRMIAVPVSEEFDDGVYSEAMEMVVGAAAGVASVSGLGWGLPWAVRVRIAELLMAAGFNSEEEGQPILEQESLVYVLRHHLWPILDLPVSLHDVLNAWAYLRQFALTGNAALLGAGRELIDAIRQRQHRGPRRSSGSSTYESEADSFVDSVMKAAADWVASRLSTYRQFDDAGPIPGLLEVLVSCQRCLGQQSRLTEILEECIGSSVQAEFDRAVKEVLEANGPTLPKDSNRIVTIAACCSDILDEEVAYFSPLFSSYVKQPAEIAAIRVHSCFNSFLLPFLQTVHTLEDSNLEAIRAAVGLESKLQTLVGERLCEGLDWAILERLTPLLHLWVANQLSLVQSWYERIFASESWQAVSQPRGCSRSAVELVKIVRETLEALFDLHLGIPEEVITAAGTGLDSFLQRYAQQTAAEVGSPSFMIPPVPALTRYKKEVAIKAAAAEGRPGPNTPPRHARNNSSLGEDLAHGTLDQEQLAELPNTSFTVRMNSLDYIRTQLSALSEIIIKRWGVSEREGPMWVENMFDNTRNAVARSIDSIVHFTVTKVVYRDLSPQLAGLYKHEVAQTRIGPLLEAVDEKLGSLCSSADVEVHSLIARGLLQATLDALLRVLLHGGPNRWFKTSDVDLIEEDLEDLRALFHAEGEGLPLQDITRMCASVSDLITVLQLETEILINNLKKVRMDEKAGRVAGKQPLAYDSQILLHILAHREDHAASKYLKKEFALPKKLDGGNVLTGGLSFSGFGGRKDSGNTTVENFKKKLSFGNFSRK